TPRAFRMLGFFLSSRRRHTRWPRDWSSDVCSSDLTVSSSGCADEDLTQPELETVRGWSQSVVGVAVEEMQHLVSVSNLLMAIGGDRKSVVQAQGGVGGGREAHRREHDQRAAQAHVP